MSERAYESFFLQPNDAVQRRYEVLRAVLVEQQPMREVGKYFEISYGTVRNWVSEFRRQWDAGQLPFFSFPRLVAGRRKMPAMTTHQK